MTTTMCAHEEIAHDSPASRSSSPGLTLAFSVVCAVNDTCGGIGASGTLPWHVPGDLKWFKSLTKNAIVIMGRNTWQSLPGRRPLPGRINIVVSTTATILDTDAHADQDLGLYQVSDFEEALSLASESFADKPVFVIGGRRLYEMAMNDVRCRCVYMTRMVYEDAGRGLCTHECFDTLLNSDWLQSASLSDQWMGPVPVESCEEDTFQGVSLCDKHRCRVLGTPLVYRRGFR